MIHRTVISAVIIIKHSLALIKLVLVTFFLAGIIHHHCVILLLPPVNYNIGKIPSLLSCQNVCTSAITTVSAVFITMPLVAVWWQHTHT